ncbi:MAG: phospholipase [Candidatus Latescibacteria bacterium]|nr:phospholipase [Candidatus Latescibacterota bacterium]
MNRIEILRQLQDDDLLALARGIQAGRLRPPFTTIALQRYLVGTACDGLAGALQELFEDGLKPEHLALFLETLAADRKDRGSVLDLLDLVSTGPEVPGTDNRDTSVVVRELFATARKYVLVAGYAVYQGQQIFLALAEQLDTNPALKVKMFLDVQRHPTDTSKDSEILARFSHRFRTKEWPGQRLPEVYYDPRSLERDSAKKASLHAKCIVVDNKQAFISSANFTEAAQIRNIEIGTLIRSAPFAQRLARHFEALAGAGLLAHRK